MASPFSAPIVLLLSAATRGTAPQDTPSREVMYARTLAFSLAVEGGSVEPAWSTRDESFTYASARGGARTFWRVDARGKAPYFDDARLRRALEAAAGRPLRSEGLPLTSFVELEEGRAVRFDWRGSAWRLDLASYALEELPPAEEDEPDAPRELRVGFTAGPPVVETASRDGRRFLGDDERDLDLRASDDDERRPLTDDGEEGYAYTCQGAAWSPDDRWIVAMRIDTRGVDRLPVIDWLGGAVEGVEEHPYTKAGRPMARTELVAIEVESGARRTLEGLGLVDSYVTPLGWDETHGEFAWLRMDRRYQKLELLASDPATGATRTILTETSETFIGALDYHVRGATLLFPVGDAERFLWISERDGWRHLYLYDREGTRIGQVTSGAWEVERVVHVDAGAGWVYFLGHAEPDPYETHLYRVRLSGEDHTRLTEGAGEHTVTFSPSGATFVDNWSSPLSPPRCEYRRADGTLLCGVERADVSRLAGTGWRPPRPFVCHAADGETELHGLLYVPFDFDSARRYPVIDYIYNGPFTKWVPRTFLDARGAQSQALAQLGFVVLIVDGRGTIGRGKEFQDVVHRRWGQNEVPDHAAALRQLAAERPWMDTSRVGIHGGSWGGYMTLRAMLTHPDVYHVGVAVAFVADLLDHASLPIEGYMGLPEDNPEGYATASNLTLAERLEGELLLIHGTSDVNATFSACMKMVSALIQAGKRHDLIVLPAADHWMQRGPGGEAVYYNRARREYFVEHLRPGDVTGSEPPARR